MSLLDHFCIFTQSGLVLWQKDLSQNAATTPDSLSGALDAMIKEKLIQHSARDQEESFTSSSYSIRWTTDNMNHLVFAVVFPRILTLTYIPTLLQTVKTVFLNLFGSVIKQVLQVLVDGASPSILPDSIRAQLFGSGGIQSLFQDWEQTFAQILRQVEASQGRYKRDPASIASTPTLSRTASTDVSAVSSAVEPVLDSESIARNMQAFKVRQRAKSAKHKKGEASGSETAGSDTDASFKLRTASTKEMRRWGDVGSVTKEEMAALDFSPVSTPKKNQSNGSVDASFVREAFVDQSSIGNKAKNGLYSVADYAVADKPSKQEAPSGLWNRLATTVGLSARTLTAEDLAPVLASMQDQLLTRNVAKEVTDAIIKSASASLLGVSVKGAGSSALRNAVKKSITETLKRILSPKDATDIILEIQRKRANGKDENEPYAITFVGVNGVGKSTNLSKVAYWLLQNNLRVLIAACDTFRSGAVEQLRVHVKNLRQLESNPDENRIELYEKGYGKDAAGIAKEAISYARSKGFDVVLIDTAGRMQDNEPLMRALAKLAAVNKPDKIVFVGEALVGNEAVDQLVKFNTSLRNFSSMSGAAKGIDGIILTKFDTIDDKVGAAVSMTYVTGQPLLFVGTGQTYSDLRSLRVETIVDALLA